MDKEPFIRNQEGSRVYYDALSSNKRFYYTVEMLGLLAISCDCDHHVKGHQHCKHMTGAEKAEKEFQAKLETSRSTSGAAEQRLTSSLQGTRPFSLNR